MSVLQFIKLLFLPSDSGQDQKRTQTNISDPIIPVETHHDENCVIRAKRMRTE